jgi:2-polyprenyl-3-methyl-5-hydroxy-6-metoxy-1,4-benzoquinol methylase
VGDVDPKQIVRLGYDSASLLYRGDDDYPAQYADWIARLQQGVLRGARLLDLGCGCGVPVAKELARHGASVTGVDISDVQIARARRLVPGATFLAADIAEISFAPASFDAVCSFYSLIHLPHDEQRQLIDRIGQWLKSGGMFIATVGHTAWTGEEARWLGGDAAMWWSHPAETTYRSWIESAGMEIHDQLFVPEGSSGHTLFVATRRVGYE